MKGSKPNMQPPRRPAYQIPAIVYDAPLEAQAGSPLGNGLDLFDPASPANQ